MNAVDTNVIIYACDSAEPIKQAKAQQLFHTLLATSGATFLLWQVLVEFVHQLRRWKDQGKLTELQFEQNIRFYRNKFPLVFPSATVLDHALDLAKRYSLSHWDSMILGACKAAGVSALYTEDMGAPRNIDGIQLFNPFI